MRRRVVGRVAETIGGVLTLSAWVREADVPNNAKVDAVAPAMTIVAEGYRARTAVGDFVAPLMEVVAEGSIVGVQPLAAWRFDEDSGTNAADAIGSFEGTHYVADGLVTVDVGGVVGRAVQYGDVENGEIEVDAYTSMGDVLDFERTDPFSICLWLQMPDGGPGDAVTLIAKRNGAGTTGYHISIDPYIGFGMSGGGEFLSAFFLPTLGTGWNHIAITYDGSSTAAGVSAYINGVAQVLTIGSDTLTSASTLNDGDFTIGGLFETSVMVIDDVAVFRRELTAETVEAIFEAGQSGVSVADSWWSVVPWTPLDLTPRLWLRADLGVTLRDSTYVTEWGDQSGNSRNFAQSTEANQPIMSTIGGQPAVFMDTTAKYLEEVASLIGNLTTFTILTVVNARTPGAGGLAEFTFVGNAGIPQIYHSDSAGLRGYYDGTHRTVAGAVGGEQQTALVLDAVGGTGQHYLNGAALGSALGYAGAMNIDAGKWRICYPGGSSGAGWSIAELVIVPRAIDVGELALWSAYCSMRYGL